MLIYRGKAVKVLRPIELARIGEQGKDWYREAISSIKDYSERHGFSLKRVADIISITSPQVSVKYNITLATRYLEKGTTQGMMLGRIRALQKYERTGEFYGPKVTAFSKALQGDLNAVVVDTWMFKAFNQEVTDNKKIHRHIVTVTRATATRLGWAPAEAQAAIWSGIRKQCGFTKANKLLMP
jgi:hypothetical protein